MTGKNSQLTLTYLDTYTRTTETFPKPNNQTLLCLLKQRQEAMSA